MKKSEPGYRAFVAGSIFCLSLWGVLSSASEDRSDLLKRNYIAFSLANQGHHLTNHKNEDGSWTITTTGTDPYLSTRELAEACDPFTPYVVAFQYRAPTDYGNFQVIYETPGGLKHINTPLPPSKTWRWHFFDLSKSGEGLGEPVKWLRFDFGNQVDKTFHIRNGRLIKASPHFDITKEDFTPFHLNDRGHQVKMESLPNESGWKILTTGNDPYIGTKGLVEARQPATPYIIAFEYQAPPDFGDIHFYYGTPGGIKHVNAGVAPADDWTWHLYDFSVEEKITWFRIDFGLHENREFKVRNCRLIKATPELRQRAALGDKADRVDRFGISLQGVNHQESSVETIRYTDDESLSVVVSAYRHLDLDAETKRLDLEPPVPLGPRLVAGEGEHRDNHTVVRILSPYQICEAQFLAYPPSIRGGIGVESARASNGTTRIVTWPLQSKATREIRLFNRFGGLVGSIDIPTRISPPFIIATGDFFPNEKGDEIAVTSRFLNRETAQVNFYTPDGAPLPPVSIPKDFRRSGDREYALLTKNSARLILQDLSAKRARQIHPPQSAEIDFSAIKPPVRLFDSAFSDREFNGGGPEDSTSTLHPFSPDQPVRTLDAGRMENIFWFDPQEVHDGSVATWEPLSDGNYIKNGLYNFLGSAQFWSPLVSSGNIENRSYQDWVSGIDWERRAFGGKHRKSIKDYNKGVPTVWTACFTHRWSTNAARAIASKRDPKTWLPKYLLLDRKNDTAGGGYFGKRLFDYGSQNFEQEALDHLYTYSQRALYRKLAPAYRAEPEMTIAVEPNHENEIVSGRDSIGDYNPKNIEGFYHYLSSLYGDIDSINRKMGTRFSPDFFDPPRGLFRGDWDRYDQDNLYFREWVEYNRIIIYRRVGSSYREALMAGFPPELIKCHQIPDSYVFGSIVGISEGEVRISPIDWLLTTGAGFGFSRYGTYYHKRHNIGQGAHSSGFDSMLIGEYASLNPDPARALGQLLYLRERGVSALHVMWWPDHLDKGYNAAQHTALREIITNHDTPKPGLAGGISQVRPWKNCDLASLGTGEKHTGLIKSLRGDGSFEGSVYVVPFHARVDIKSLCEKESLSVSDTPVSLATETGIRQGTVLEVTFQVETGSNLELGLSHAGIPLANQTVPLPNLKPGQQVRVIYKIPLILDEISLSLSAPNEPARIQDLTVIRHQDQSINLTRGIMEGKRHRGGITFDILPEGN